MTKNDAVERADDEFCHDCISVNSSGAQTRSISKSMKCPICGPKMRKWIGGDEALQTSRPVTYGGTADDHVCHHDSGTSAMPPIKGLIGASESSAARLGDLDEALTLSSESRVQTSRPDAADSLDADEWVDIQIEHHENQISELKPMDIYRYSHEYERLKTIRAALKSGDMNDEQIKYMRDRFLGWKLPEDFYPDGGISFKKTFNDHLTQPTKHEPSGTNLFDAQQAEAMIRYMIEGMP